MPPQPGPGPIAIVHRVTIVTALLGAMAFTVWAAVERRLGAGVGGLAATIAVGFYLRGLRGRLDEKLTPRAR